MIRIDEIKIYSDITEKQLFDKVCSKYKISKEDFVSGEIVKKSIDARDKSNVHYSYSVNIQVKNEKKYPKLKKIEVKPDRKIEVKRTSELSPVIVGAGPAGLFCALTLVENGVKPIIIEQGDCVENRIRFVEEYRTTGNLNERCNVQFGEGGAGTFSDGKLTTGVNSEFIRKVLNLFYKFGAPKEITYESLPHIGTDNLVKILVNIRHYIEENGGKYFFNTKFTDYLTNEDGTLTIECEDKQFITDALVLAIGHSARDTFKMLKNHNVTMHRKNFSVGVRIEHKREMINASQYGTETELDLPAASYKLVYHGDNRSCYSFCMCPGGEVIASASEKGRIVTNGMSKYNRDEDNSNAALLVNVLTTDFEGDDPLAGMYFQDALEKKAYVMGGSKDFAPVQRVEDFENNKVSEKIGYIIPSYKPGYTLSNLNELFPEFVSKTLAEALPYFDKRIKGFNDPDAILTAVESRTSSPVTIVRDEKLQMVNNECIYPCGEGAGYAGGITTAAVDGIKVAISILEKE